MVKMNTKDTSTEKAILEAAKIVFMEKGFDGARMQQIADKAGMNKALIHYYFRSKDKLFDAIFSEAFQQFLPRIAETLSTDKPFLKKVEIFVDTYITMLQKNPHLPVFILHEINRSPERIIERIKNQGIDPTLFEKMVSNEVKEGKIKKIDFRHFIVNMIGLCIFPFVARPIIQGFIFKNNEREYDLFLAERKQVVTKLLIESLKPTH
jgi:TetR/AcrR family transcriptional regulator